MVHTTESPIDTPHHTTPHPGLQLPSKGTLGPTQSQSNPTQPNPPGASVTERKESSKRIIVIQSYGGVAYLVCNYCSMYVAAISFAGQGGLFFMEVGMSVVVDGRCTQAGGGYGCLHKLRSNYIRLV